MKLLQELQNRATLELSHSQQGTLALIVASATPQSAYDATSGSENLETSRQMLEKFGFIIVGDNYIETTNRGGKAAISYNIKDEGGKITEVGQKLIADILEDKRSWESTS